MGSLSHSGFTKDPRLPLRPIYSLSLNKEFTFYYRCIRALQFPPEAWLRIGLDHASITWITIRPNGRVSVRRVGDSGFIPVGEVTVS